MWPAVSLLPMVLSFAISCSVIAICVGSAVDDAQVRHLCAVASCCAASNTLDLPSPCLFQSQGRHAHPNLLTACIRLSKFAILCKCHPRFDMPMTTPNFAVANAVLPSCATLWLTEARSSCPVSWLRWCWPTGQAVSLPCLQLARACS